MSEQDKEIQEINQKKLKEKGAKIVNQQQEKYDPERILLELLGFMQQRGLEMLNISNDVRAAIANNKQQNLTKQNIPDSEKH
jgi:hypothetical protein